MNPKVKLAELHLCSATFTKHIFGLQDRLCLGLRIEQIREFLDMPRAICGEGALFHVGLRINPKAGLCQSGDEQVFVRFLTD